jgi:hypothetical protein
MQSSKSLQPLELLEDERKFASRGKPLATMGINLSVVCTRKATATEDAEHPSPLNHMTLARSAFQQQHQRGWALVVRQ